MPIVRFDEMKYPAVEMITENATPPCLKLIKESRLISSRLSCNAIIADYAFGSKKGYSFTVRNSLSRSFFSLRVSGLSAISSM